MTQERRIELLCLKNILDDSVIYNELSTSKEHVLEKMCLKYAELLDEFVKQYELPKK